MGKLGGEEIVCAKVLHEKGRSIRSIAAEGVYESTVRRRMRRLRLEIPDGRLHKPEACARFADLIAARMADQAQASGRPQSVRVIYERLVAEHGFTGTYKSVLRYVRRRTPLPPMRPVRRVETRPGFQAQVDWVESRSLIVEELGSHPVRLQAFVMTLSHSRMWAVVWSVRQDLLSWLLP